MVCYESRKLNENEQNYVTLDLDLVAIIHVFKMWRHYLLGRKFTLITNHGGLKYLFEQPKLNAKQAKWLAMLDEFEFEIKYMRVRRTKWLMHLAEE